MAIKLAYQKLARVYHPDQGGEKTTFQYIHMVYETMYDDEKRREYDLHGK